MVARSVIEQMPTTATSECDHNDHLVYSFCSAISFERLVAMCHGFLNEISRPDLAGASGRDDRARELHFDEMRGLCLTGRFRFSRR